MQMQNRSSQNTQPGNIAVTLIPVKQVIWQGGHEWPPLNKWNNMKQHTLENKRQAIYTLS